MPDSNSPYINPQLAEHLAGFAAKGTSLESAKEALQVAGWTTEEINAALKTQPYSEKPAAPNTTYTPSLPVFTEPASQNHRFISLSLIASVLLLGAFIIYSLFHFSATPPSKTSGTISTNDCLAENGTISGLSSKTCQIGSVQLTIIDN